MKKFTESLASESEQNLLDDSIDQIKEWLDINDENIERWVSKLGDFNDLIDEFRESNIDMNKDFNKDSQDSDIFKLLTKVESGELNINNIISNLESLLINR